ncbi:MAG: hypothetical protein IJF07_09425, partial [Lachnospiraceae bacterium]|nr:hypothetical protein [Lachnospiraceae bacterium]
MKRLIAQVMTICILLSMFLGKEMVYAQEGCLQEALEWVISNQNPNGSFGNEELIKDTTEAAKLLRDMGIEYDTSFLETVEEKWMKDNDSLSRLYCATGEENYLALLPDPNRDGGYGLTAAYTSDVLDSMLVLEAFVRKNRIDGRYEEEIAGLLQYLGKVQKEDGGFSYLPDMESDKLLTAQIGMLVAGYEKYGNKAVETALLEGVDAYLTEHPDSLTAPDSQECFEEFCYRAAYLCLRGRISATEDLHMQLMQLQSEDGSFFQDLNDTIAAVRLLWAIDEFHKPYIKVQGMETTLSSYTLYEGYERQLTIQSQIYYQCNTDYKGNWCVEVLQNGEVVSSKEQAIDLEQRNVQIPVTREISLTAEEGKVYQIHATLLFDGKVLCETWDDLYVKQLVIEDLKLEAESKGSEGVALDWNDISNDFCRYGYRIYRSDDGENWESKSSWNGMEGVKVLNIYPAEYTKDYLSDWMNTNLEKEQIPAGKGLFEIDKVSIDAYNANPYEYLLDENGGYQYDVLIFGACDTNAGKDLNQLSYRATKEFMEAGRGILFGHDTIVKVNGCYHPVFSQFEEALGIKLGTTNLYATSEKVKVVNSGFLTSYPWKVEGLLTVPATHASQQYVGGSLKATVWMEFQDGGYRDTATGGCTNGYLFTRNQLAMIQTGHSDGKATDDERKVLANTLFYLKQLTNNTETVDKSAYDLAAPKACETGELISTQEGIRLMIQAEDRGTRYDYYVEALPQVAFHTQPVGEEILSRRSDIAEVEVCSGVAGYVYCINDTE